MSNKTKASGKFVLRLPESLHKNLRKVSERHGISLNELCKRELESAMSPNRKINSENKNQLISDSLIEKISEVWKKELLAIILFGSAVREELREDSDLDLMIVLKEDSPITRSLYKTWQEELSFLAEQGLHEVSPHFVSLSKNALSVGSIWLEVALEGQILWEKDFSVSRFIVSLRKLIAEGKIRRYYSENQAYWVKEQHA